MTRKSPPKTRFELIDKDGNKIGRFSSAQLAVRAAEEQWPDQKQDEERSGKGWDISVIGADDAKA